MKNLLKYSLLGISATLLFSNCGPQKTEEVVEEVVEVLVEVVND